MALILLMRLPHHRCSQRIFSEPRNCGGKGYPGRSLDMDSDVLSKRESAIPPLRGATAGALPLLAGCFIHPPALPSLGGHLAGHGLAETPVYLLLQRYRCLHILITYGDDVHKRRDNLLLFANRGFNDRKVMQLVWKNISVIP